MQVIFRLINNDIGVGLDQQNMPDIIENSFFAVAEIIKGILGLSMRFHKDSIVH